MRSARASLGTNELIGAAGIALSALLLYGWSRWGTAAAVVVGSLPLVAVASAWLIQSGRVLLLAAVILMPMSGIAIFNEPLPVPGPTVFPQDVVLLLALGAWAFDHLIFGRNGGALPTPRSIVHGWPLVLFALAVFVATLRGHYAYGATLFGQPLRLPAYAAIVVTLAGLNVKSLYRLLRAVLYSGTIVTMLWAAYYIATGSSQTDQSDLSTGGTRILGISISIFCASALFFALLSLRLSPRGGTRILHLTMAALAFSGVILGFGRAVFAATALVCALLLAFSAPVRTSLLSVLPLALPVLVLAAIMLPHVAPEIVQAARERVSTPPASDPNVQWREKANEAVFAQVREQPLFGVGFGRASHFFIGVPSDGGVVVPLRVDIDQDPHDGYLFLWAGGGLAALGSFVLILVAAVFDGRRRFTQTTDATSRLLILWSGATCFVFLFNAASGTTFEVPSSLMMIWLTLSVPAVVMSERRRARPGPSPPRPDEARAGGRLQLIT